MKINQDRRRFPKAFAAAGGLLLLFILLPLLAALLSTTPNDLVETILDAEVRRSIAVTASAAVASTLIGLGCGVPLAYLLARYRFPAKQLVEAVIDLPIIIPHTAAGIALLMVFGRQGWLGKFMAAVGVFFTDTPAGIVAAMLFVSIPYLVNLSREAFSLIDPEMERVAAIDGASPWMAFWHVTLPLAWRGIASGALMMWARGVSEFGAVVILAYHPRVVPVLILERFQGFGLSSALPIAVYLILLTMFVFIVMRWILRRET